MYENNICVCWHGCFTVVALQSLNLSLQTQLNESRRERDDLQQENMRLQKAMEDKDSDLKLHKDLCELENSRLRLGKSSLLDSLFSFKSRFSQYMLYYIVIMILFTIFINYSIVNMLTV